MASSDVPLNSEPLVNPGGGSVDKLIQRIPFEDGGPTLQPLPTSIEVRLQPIEVSHMCSTMLAHLHL